MIDGQYHTVANLRICRQDGKYTALVGYLGDENFTSPAIRDLGLVNLKIEGKKTCGAFAGVCYGTMENCFATGTIKAKETTGGLVGKCEGALRNCVSYMKVKAKSMVGGLVGSTETGGTVENCYVGGSVTAGDGKASAGGVSGAFSAATYLRNVTSVIHEVGGDEGVSDIDRLVGTLESESGANITNNYIWEGSVLNGNAPLEHPNRSVAQAVSAGALMGKALYEKQLGWDFNKTWNWGGESDQGYPMLAGFVKAGSAPDLLEDIREDLTVEKPLLLTGGESVAHYLTEGWEEVQSHWATVTGLAAETVYEYAVGGVYEGKEVRSGIHTFTTLPASGSFTFMQYGDLQAEEPEGYDPFLNTLEQFVATLPVQPDFMLNTGDIVDAGYKSTQWASFFDVAQTYMADRLNILLPGNHETAGDPLYKQCGARTSLPNEMEYGPLEGTGWCVIGDACFVFVNTAPYSGREGADIEADRARFFEEQTAWAKEVYEKADCTWRIMASHVGTYIVNFNDPSDYPYIPEMCDELQVDLYMNGHDHEYIRTTTKDNIVCPIGSGTTYMTCSSLGKKLDAFEEGTAASKYAVVHKDGAEESQQIFSMVTVDGDGIHVTAWIYVGQVLEVPEK